MRIGSDAGGTFTDLVTADGRITKVPSTPSDPAEAVRVGIRALAGEDSLATLLHGTTVATNALLERRGASVALVTTEGFADVIEIARQDRPSLYDQTVDRPEPLVPRAWRYEVRERLDGLGRELVLVDVGNIPLIDERVETVAVCLLHADLDPSHEELVARVLQDRGLDVTLSSTLSPEFREYERTVTTVVNAYLRPRCRAYLDGLTREADEVLVMTSAGGLVPAADAALRPAALLLSGPSGGVTAGAAIAVANGYPDAITFDMGGTSTDVCLVLGGAAEPAPEREVAGFPVRLPSLDVQTIGAGGGSIASLDHGGALVVGPQSAGAVPGPACYGGGGIRPTVTDADLVAGRMPEDAELPGLRPLDLGAARRALDGAGLEAEGVLAVVDANMEQALRRVSVERGVDPRSLALVAFGGAGPLHACALADALAMPVVIIPPRAGVFSAVGILTAPRQIDLVRSWPTPQDHEGAEKAAVALTAETLRQLLSDDESWTSDARHNGVRLLDGTRIPVTHELDCRYVGQSHELRVSSVAEFHRVHEQRNGYARPDQPVEVVAIRAQAAQPSPVKVADLPIVERSGAVGPAVIAEPDCTIWVPPGWRTEPGAAGALLLKRVES